MRNSKGGTILISVVGDRDPVHPDAFTPDSYRSDAPFYGVSEFDRGPILETWEIVSQEEEYRKWKPKRAYLLYTDDGKAKKILERTNWLKEFFDNQRIPTTLEDLQGYDKSMLNPADLSAAFNSMTQCFEKISHENPGGHFVILTSPGTPQMEAVWLALGNEGLIHCELIQKFVGSRDYTTKTRQSVGSLQSVRFSPIFESERLERSRNALLHLDYSTASDSFKRLSETTVYVWRKDLYDSISVLALLYHYWAMNDFSECLRILKTNPRLHVDINLPYIANIEIDLKNMNRLEVSVSSILQRARLRHFVRDYAYSVVEAFSAYEKMLTQTLYAAGVDVSRFDIPMKEQELLRINHQGMNAIFRHMSWTNHTGNPSTLIDKVRVARNDVVHKGLRPGEATSKNCLDIIDRAAIHFLNVKKSTLANFSFSVKSLQAIDRYISDTCIYSAMPAPSEMGSTI